MSLEKQDYCLSPIGYVRASWKECRQIPVQGGPAQIVVEPQFADALEGVERGTHLVIIGYLDRADRTVLQARPRKLNPSAPACGVFASRSPVRPNPLSLTVVELLCRSGLKLDVDPLDLVDGTPIVDIKAYSPGWDTVFAAKREQRVPATALSDTQLAVFLQRDLRNHVGALHQSPLAQATLTAVLNAVRHLGIDPRSLEFNVEVGRCDLVTDAIMGMTGASFGNGRLHLNGSLKGIVFKKHDQDFHANPWPEL